jgi:cardiolipin synthase
MFVEEYLKDLRRRHYTPGAIGRYVARCTVMSVEAALNRPRTLSGVALAGLGHLVGLLVIAVFLSFLVDRRLAADYFVLSAWWLLGGLAWITLHLGMFRRDEELFRSGLGLPNFLTLGRLLAIPAFYLFITRDHGFLALAAFLAGGLSDVADGIVARRLNASTKMGRIFDPIVDVLFNAGVVLGLAYAGYLPFWIAALVFLRYGLLMLGAAFIYITRGPVAIRPTILGKSTGVVSSGLVAAVVVVHAFVAPRPADQILELLYYTLGFVLLLAIVQVLIIGFYNLRHAGHVPVAHGAMAVILGKQATGEGPLAAEGKSSIPSPEDIHPQDGEGGKGAGP